MNRKSRILVTLTSVVLALAISALAQSSDSQQEEHFVRNFAVNSGSTLAVENYKGTIHVSGGEGNQIVVTVDKKFEGTDSDRKWWMVNTRVSFENNPTRVRVGVQYPNVNCAWMCDDHSNYTGVVELTIQVPRHTNLDIKGYKPDMRLSAIDGDIRISSYKSPVDIESTTGAIKIDTYKETVRLHGVSIRGSLHLEMEKGEALIEAKNLGDEVSIETEKGSVELRVPRNAGLTVDFSGSRRSEFRSDLPISSEAGFHSSEVRGTINGGGTRLHLRTGRGSFSIEGS
ncbi:MAG TPA: DUF4097 family beta strand repeat-containing protein [Terriglobales bacterium]|nr:DUF4097 family beta strand repeat-containing protein [Terriglobales bacterium]